MNLSYWEYKSWLSQVDFTIVGSGIVGLNCALALKKRYPKAMVLVLEKGMLPQGASTKNAGFACFGSISEVLADLNTHTVEEVRELVQKRWEGVQLLCTTLGKSAIGYEQHQGHELFLKPETALYERCLTEMPKVNELLEPIFKGVVFTATKNSFGFNGIQDRYITNRFEGQLDTGKMMKGLLQRVQKAGVQLLNGIRVDQYVDRSHTVAIKTDQFEFSSRKLLIATNGFASQLVPLEVRPARAQVLVTRPIPGLGIKGTFHLDEGYYYFRNIDGRILLGGGRNLDFKGEETTQFGSTEQIQQRLEQLLRDVVLPGKTWEIAHRWSGIMGVGNQKKPIIERLSENVSCGLRLGGMGVAIGSQVGKELAALA